MKRTFLAFFPLGLWAVAVLLVGGLEISPTGLPSGSDKVAHFAMYGVGGALAAWAGRKQGSAKAAWIGLLMVGMTGIVDELRQISIPHRNADIMDWVADATGALLSFLVADRLLKTEIEDG